MPVPEALVTAEGMFGAVSTDRIAEGRFVGILAVLHAMRGEFDKARELYGRSQQIAAELGPSLWVSAASMESSRVETLAGEPASAERELRRDYTKLEAIGESYYRSSIACLLAHALIAQQRYPEATEFLDIAERLADDDDLFTQIFWRTGRAKVWAAIGRGDEARVLAIQAIELASTSDDIEQRADALSDLAEVERLAGHADRQAPPLSEALALYSQKGDVVSAAATSARLGVAAGAV